MGGGGLESPSYFGRCFGAFHFRRRPHGLLRDALVDHSASFLPSALAAAFAVAVSVHKRGHFWAKQGLLQHGPAIAAVTCVTRVSRVTRVTSVTRVRRVTRVIRVTKVTRVSVHLVLWMHVIVASSPLGAICRSLSPKPPAALKWHVSTLGLSERRLPSFACQGHVPVYKNTQFNYASTAH
jgi:hypothetical protein